MHQRCCGAVSTNLTSFAKLINLRAKLPALLFELNIGFVNTSLQQRNFGILCLKKIIVLGLLSLFGLDELLQLGHKGLLVFEFGLSIPDLRLALTSDLPNIQINLLHRPLQALDSSITLLDQPLSRPCRRLQLGNPSFRFVSLLSERPQPCSSRLSRLKIPP